MYITHAIERFGMEFLEESPSLQESQLRITAERISSQLYFTELKEPGTNSVFEVYLRLLELYTEQNSLTELPSRYLSKSPWAIITSMEEGQPELASRPGFLDQYFGLLSVHKPRSVLPALVHVFLFYYPIKKRYFEQLRSSILNLFTVISSPRIKKLHTALSHSGFLSERGHEKLVNDLKLSSSISKTLESYRLTGALEKGRFTEYCLGHYLKEIGPLFVTQNEQIQLAIVTNILAFISKNDSLEFPSLRVQIADALLAPFHQQLPHTSSQELLKRFFIKVYGDPRLNKSRWVGVSEKSMEVMRQWLVEDTLEDFFKLLSHVAHYDETADRHWAYRKQFWQAYVRKGFISEAWVVLGPKARSAASNFLGPNKSYYASLRAPDRKHSSLIMKIGDLVITEWSHSGSYRAWHEHNSPPNFYRSEYTRDDLIRNPDYEGSHHGSVNGGWQRQLSNIIHDNTGLYVSYSEYMND